MDGIIFDVDGTLWDSVEVVAESWNLAKVTEGDVVSASVLEVEKGDSVYWAFGTMAQANEYFATRVANN